jgi:hypothetical protein
MNAKPFIICLFLLPLQIFAQEECKGIDVSNWDNCIGNESTLNGSADLGQYETSSWSKGFYKDGKKHGFFNEGLWVRRHDISSDGYQEAGNYVNGIRQGLWGYCYFRQVSYTYLMIGNYNEKGQRDGPWGTFNTYDQDFKDKDGNYSNFMATGCHIKTALLYLNKEDPCSDKKSPTGGNNLFTDITIYKDDESVGSGGYCNHPIYDKSGEYKNTSSFKKWVELLENYGK